MVKLVTFLVTAHKEAAAAVLATTVVRKVIVSKTAPTHVRSFAAIVTRRVTKAVNARFPATTHVSNAPTARRWAIRRSNARSQSLPTRRVVIPATEEVVDTLAMPDKTPLAVITGFPRASQPVVILLQDGRLLSFTSDPSVSCHLDYRLDKWFVWYGFFSRIPSALSNVNS